ACVRVTHNGKSIKAKVTDQCPGCPVNLDLSRTAFGRLADHGLGIINVEYEVVDCDDGEMEFVWEPSTAYWMSVQVKGTKKAVKKLEVQRDGGFQEIRRQNHNRFFGDRLGDGPFTFRVTFIDDSHIIHQNIELNKDTRVSSSGATSSSPPLSQSEQSAPSPSPSPSPKQEPNQQPANQNTNLPLASSPPPVSSAIESPAADGTQSAPGNAAASREGLSAASVESPVVLPASKVDSDFNPFVRGSSGRTLDGAVGSSGQKRYDASNVVALGAAAALVVVGL
ncbi:hypothetical protein HK102_006682, partial [Quaeritorhiza haematococci]